MQFPNARLDACTRDEHTHRETHTFAFTWLSGSIEDIYTDLFQQVMLSDIKGAAWSSDQQGQIRCDSVA